MTTDQELFEQSMSGNAVRLDPQSDQALKYLRSQPERARRAEAKAGAVMTQAQRLAKHNAQLAAELAESRRREQIYAHTIAEAQLDGVDQPALGWGPIVWGGIGAAAGGLIGFMIGRASK